MKPIEYIFVTDTGADPGFCQGGWVGGWPQKLFQGAAPRKMFGALLGGLGASGGMVPQKKFKIESARLA